MIVCMQAIWIVIILGWFFMPVYKQCRVMLTVENWVMRQHCYVTMTVQSLDQVSTMPQYLECRYRNPHLRSYLTCLALLIYVSTKISV